MFNFFIIIIIFIIFFTCFTFRRIGLLAPQYTFRSTERMVSCFQCTFYVHIQNDISHKGFNVFYNLFNNVQLHNNNLNHSEKTSIATFYLLI